MVFFLENVELRGGATYRLKNTVIKKKLVQGTPWKPKSIHFLPNFTFKFPEKVEIPKMKDHWAVGELYEESISRGSDIGPAASQNLSNQRFCHSAWYKAQMAKEISFKLSLQQYISSP